MLAISSDDLFEWSIAGRSGCLPPAWPLWPMLGIDELAAEVQLKLLGVRPLGKAEDIHVDAVAVKAMAARAKRKPLAEKADGDVVAAAAISMTPASGSQLP